MQALNYKIEIDTGTGYRAVYCEASPDAVVARYVEADEVRERLELLGTFVFKGNDYRAIEPLINTAPSLPIKVYTKQAGVWVLQIETLLDLTTAQVYPHVHTLECSPIINDIYGKIENIADTVYSKAGNTTVNTTLIPSYSAGNGVRLISVLSNILFYQNFNVSVPSTMQSFAPYLYADTELRNIVVIPKLNAFNQNGAGRVELTARAIFEIYRLLFNLEWYVVNDDGLKIKLKHPSEQQHSGTAIDFTTYKATNWAAESTYTIDANKKRVGAEIWETEKTNNADFDAEPIIYNNNFTEETRHPLQYINTYIADVVQNNGNYKEDGYIIVACIEGVVYDIINATGLYSGFPQSNGKLAMPRLIKEHHMYKRPYLNGTVNPGETTPDATIQTATPGRQISPIEAPLADINAPEVAFNKYYTTGFTTAAKLRRVELPINGGLATWNLIF